MDHTKEGALIAPADGRTVPLHTLPDPAFAEGMLGEGVAIAPARGQFVSPCNGQVVGVSETGHAYNLESEDGLELLLHIGIDTVELKGQGFAPKVKAGDCLRAGDLLAEVDLAFVEGQGYSTLTPLLIVNADRITAILPADGQVQGGKDPVLHYQIKEM